MIDSAIRIGTRGSKLALAQAHRAQAAIEKLGHPTRIQIIDTAGDKDKNKPMAQSSEVGFFTKEIEQALYEDTIDVAVHSLKDLPTSLAPGLRLDAVLPRDTPSDLLLIAPHAYAKRDGVPLIESASVGASSIRRQALMKLHRPDIHVQPIRGNVPTRIDRCRNGDYDAIMLSFAGLERLKLDVSPLIPVELNPRIWTPAPGQATIALESRIQDQAIASILQNINHHWTAKQTAYERQMLSAYGGGCHSPVGAYLDRRGDDYQLFLSMPNQNGQFLTYRFAASSSDDALVAAKQWVETGRQHKMARLQNLEDISWFSRTAQW